MRRLVRILQCFPSRELFWTCSTKAAIPLSQMPPNSSTIFQRNERNANTLVVYIRSAQKSILYTSVYPIIAGRHTTVLLRRLQEVASLYRGKPSANTWWRYYSTGVEYQSEVGHRLVYIGDDGLPAVRIWAHCNDFLIHGPTYQKTADAL
jgi:hypothetical protein